MVASRNARCAALLLLAALLLSCSCMGNAARVLEEEMAPPVPEDDYPAEAPEAPEQEETPSFPEFGMPPLSSVFPKVELPPMPEMPAIPGFSTPEAEDDEP
jgi:hypothetical protein